jgi:arsenate reductase
MAEGWARALKSDSIEACSAGVETHGLNPFAVEVMKEAGVDISSHRSKHVREFADTRFDVVVTVCDNARESCPVFPGNTKKIHRSFEDPPYLAGLVEGEEEKLNCYRKVRDEIRDFVRTLPESIGEE